MDYNRLKFLIEHKEVALEVNEDYVRVNHEVGNDNTWVEFEIDDRSEESIAPLINAHVSKMKSG